MKYNCRIFLLLTFCVAFCINLPAAIYNVKTYGAAGDGIIDDTHAVQAAIDEAADANNGSTVFFPHGIYRFASITTASTYLENYFLMLKSNIKISGEGKNSILKIADGMFSKTEQDANAHLFKGLDVKNVEITTLLIDLNGENNLVPEKCIKNAMAFLIFRGKNVLFNDITIKNCSGQNMIAMREGGDGLVISNCNFINGGHYVGINKENKFQVDFSFLYSEWTNTKIINNNIIQENILLALTGYSGGIEIHHSKSIVKNNRIKGCYPAMYIASTYGILKNVLVDSNQFDSCVKGVSFWCADSIENVTISNNNFSMVAATNGGIIISAIDVPNGNTIAVTKENANAAPIINLEVFNNSIQSLLPAETTEKTMGMQLHSLHNSEIKNNTISNCNLAGISFAGSKWGTKDCYVTNNIIKNNQPNIDPQAAASNIMVTDVYSSEMKDAPGFTNLVFENNTVNGKSFNSTSNATAKNLIGIFIAVPEKAAKGIKVGNNKLTGTFKEKQVIIKTPVSYK